MTGQCSIVTVERKLTAVVRTKVPFAKIPDAQRAGRAAVDGVLPSLQAGPLGRPCTRFRTPAPDMLAMEIGTIVARSFPAKGEVVPSELPAGRAAYFLLQGPFDNLPGAWKTLFDWCAAEKLALAGVNWEIYSALEDTETEKVETALYALLA